MKKEFFKKGAEAFDRAYTRRENAVNAIVQIETAAAKNVGATLHEYYVNHGIVTFTHAEKTMMDEQFKIIRNANRTMDKNLNDKQNYDWHNKYRMDKYTAI